MEFTGRIAGLGSGVSEFRVGDGVFGIEGGANGEFVTADENGVIAQKPTG